MWTSRAAVATETVATTTDLVKESIVPNTSTSQPFVHVTGGAEEVGLADVAEEVVADEAGVLLVVMVCVMVVSEPEIEVVIVEREVTVEAGRVVVDVADRVCTIVVREPLIEVVRVTREV